MAAAFDQFDLFFSGNNVYVNGNKFPLGQISVEVLDVDSEGHAMFETFLNGSEHFGEILRTFRGQIAGMRAM